MSNFNHASTAAALLLGCAAVTSTAYAQAVTHTVDFDNYSGGGEFGSGEPVTDEYADIGLQVEAMRNGQMVAATTFFSGLPTRRNYLSNIVSNSVLADFIAFNFTTPVSDISLLVNTGLPSFGVELTYYDADGNLLHTEEIYGLDITYASTLEGVAVVEARALMNGIQFFVDDLIYVIPSDVLTEEEIARFVAATGVAGRIVVINAANLAGKQGGTSLATRDLIALTDLVARRSGVAVSQDGNSFSSVTGGVYTWAEITGFRADDEGADQSFTGRGFQVGADVALSPDMVIGLSIGAQSIDASADTFEQEGTLVSLQPYLAYRAGAWSGELTLNYGQGEFDQTSVNGDGTGETVTKSIAYTGGYDIALDGGMVVTPTFGFVHGVEEIEAVSGTLEGDWSEELTFTRASIGAELSRSFASGEAFVGLHADWLENSSDNTLVTELLSDDGWTGRLGFGFSTQLESGIELDTSVELAGLGGDLQQASGGLRVAFNF